MTNFLKKKSTYMWALWAYIWTEFMYDAYPEKIQLVYDWVKNTIWWILEWTWDITQSLVWWLDFIPVIWNLAPFAVPTIVCGWVWYKLADVINKESAFLKWLLSVVWWWIWIWLQWVSASYVAWAGTLFWLYKIHEKIKEKWWYNKIYNFMKSSKN